MSVLLTVNIVSHNPAPLNLQTITITLMLSGGGEGALVSSVTSNSTQSVSYVDYTNLKIAFVYIFKIHKFCDLVKRWLSRKISRYVTVGGTMHQSHLRSSRPRRTKTPEHGVETRQPYHVGTWSTHVPSGCSSCAAGTCKWQVKTSSSGHVTPMSQVGAVGTQAGRQARACKRTKGAQRRRRRRRRLTTD